MASRLEHTKDGIKAEVWGENSILDTLQHELLELKDKIESARNKGDFGTYKNLILAFKEVVHLIHEEEERSNTLNIRLFDENNKDITNKDEWWEDFKLIVMYKEYKDYIKQVTLYKTGGGEIVYLPKDFYNKTR
jgi:hypothetical protein